MITLLLYTYLNTPVHVTLRGDCNNDQCVVSSKWATDFVIRESHYNKTTSTVKRANLKCGGWTAPSNEDRYYINASGTRYRVECRYLDE